MVQCLGLGLFWVQASSLSCTTIRTSKDLKSNSREPKRETNPEIANSIPPIVNFNESLLEASAGKPKP